MKKPAGAFNAEKCVQYQAFFMKPWAEMGERERDALVAEKVMGAVWMRIDNYPGGPADILQPASGSGRSLSAIWAEVRVSDGRTVFPAGLPLYTTSIASAWEVVEKMRSEGRWLWCSESRDGWTAVFSSHQGEAPLHPTGASSNAPEAICLAALKAKGVEP